VQGISRVPFNYAFAHRESEDGPQAKPKMIDQAAAGLLGELIQEGLQLFSLDVPHQLFAELGNQMEPNAVSFGLRCRPLPLTFEDRDVDRFGKRSESDRELFAILDPVIYGF
jgi:hypothetical protein